MPDSPEQAARENIDRLLTQAGWAVQDIKATDFHAGPGAAIRELSEEDEDASVSGLENLFKEPEPITYNSSLPIETFDFFNQNLVMEYNYEQAVADGVNVNYDVYRIRTQVTEEGGRVEAGYYVDLRDRETRKVRWEELEEDFEYDPDQLDRRVVAMDQIRTIVRTFKEKLFTEIFPGRTEVPKTIFFAKDDSHAEVIVMVLRDDGMSCGDYVEQLTYLLFLKMADERSRPPFRQPNPIPANYAWPTPTTSRRRTSSPRKSCRTWRRRWSSFG